LHVDYEALIPYLSEAVRANFNDIKSVKSKADQLQKTVDMLYDNFIKQEPSRNQSSFNTSFKRSSASGQISHFKKLLVGSISVITLLIVVIAALLLVEYNTERIDLTPKNAAELALERRVLTELFHATNGVRWKRAENWLVEGISICNWHGIVCTPSYMLRIDLSNNNLKGTLPSSLANINALERLALSDNEIYGEIPSFNETNLRELNLTRNKFSGTISPSLAYIKKLQTLILSDNELVGTIPRTFENSDSLKEMDLSHNALTGSIPQLKNYKQLSRVNLAHNQLIGSIPDTSQLNTAMHFDFSFNKLNGTLPIFSYTLVTLNLEHNKLTGDFAALRDIVYLTHLQLSNNEFTGEFAISTLAWHSLQYLNISSNHITRIPRDKADENSWPLICDASNNNLACPISNQTAIYCRANCA